MTISIPLCRTSSLLSFVRLLRANGVPISAALQRAKLPGSGEYGSDAWIPYLGMRAFVADMAGREGIDALGVRAATMSGERGIDPGLLATQYAAPILFHLLRDMPRLATAQSTHLRVWVERHGDMVRVCHRSTVGSQVPGYGIVDSHATMQAVQLVRHYCGRDWLPSRVFVNGEAHACRAREHIAPFAAAGVEAHMHARYGGFEFPASLLSMQAQAGGAYDTIAPGHAAPTIPKSISDSLRAGMSGYLADGAPPIEMMAEVMGLSRRTLQRALAGEHTTYSRILQRAKFEAAAAQLTDPNLPITEIAMKLGYSDHSAFSRAFRGWCGVTPKDYRAHEQAA